MDNLFMHLCPPNPWCLLQTWICIVLLVYFGQLPEVKDRLVLGLKSWMCTYTQTHTHTHTLVCSMHFFRCNFNTRGKNLRAIEKERVYI